MLDFFKDVFLVTSILNNNNSDNKPQHVCVGGV